MLSSEQTETTTGNGHADEELHEVESPIPASIEAVISKLVRVFAAKNPGYRGTHGDWAINFKTARPVARGRMSPVEYAATLMAKQDDASEPALDRLKRDPEALDDLVERLTDGAVYRVLILAMLAEGIR